MTHSNPLALLAAVGLETHQPFVIVDSEFTSWEGSMQRNWSGPNEHREVAQIAAIKLDPRQNMAETETFDVFVKPQINTQLSEYFMDLTQIRQADVDGGLLFAEAMQQFYDFCEQDKLQVWSYGREDIVFRENAALYNHAYPSTRDYHDFRDVLTAFGHDPSQYSSGTVFRAVGLEVDGHVHNPLHDCRSQAAYLRYFWQQGQ